MSGLTLAIDPGCFESAWVLLDEAECRPFYFKKAGNNVLRALLQDPHLVLAPDRVVIEVVASYGMAVGAEVFETCVWVGRFAELADARGVPWELVKRGPVKLHHCHSSRAKDSNVIQALVDRFAPGEPNRGKGTARSPGWFHGFRADIWQAYALGVYAADVAQGRAA